MAAFAAVFLSILRPCLLTGFALLAAACSSDRAAPTSALSADVRISPDNAVQVGAAVYGTSVVPLRLARLLGAFLVDLDPPAEGAPTGLLVREVQGPEGGSVLFTWDDRDGNGEYGSGDVFVFDCRPYQEAGLQLTGNAALENVQLIGDVSEGLNWLLEADLRCAGLEVAVGSSSSVFDGVLRFRWDQRLTLMVLTLEVVEEFVCSGRTLMPGSELVRIEWPFADSRMDYILRGATEDALLGGVVTFATGPRFTGLRFLPNPSSGLLEVAGAGGSGLRMVPLDDFFTLTLEVDQDGDGDVDAVADTEWSAF